MKKIIINYYAMFIFLIYFLYNFKFYGLKIGGLLYQIFMVLVTILNILIMIKIRDKIKCKSLCLVMYFLTILFCKNYFQLFFNLSNIIVLIVLGFILKGKVIKIISALIIMIMNFCYSIFPLILFILLLIFGTNLNEEQGLRDISPIEHYYCDNNYEAYEYSLGAMDKTHYSVGKHYEIIDIKGLLYIRYSERNQTTYEEYARTIKKYNGRKVSNTK